MSRANVLFNSFTSGLLGAKLKGRIDLAQHKTGCKLLTNMVVMPQGGVTRRPGFKYIATQKTASETVRLIPFKFSDTVAYIIELGAGYFRFYKSGAQILSGGTAYEVSNSYTQAQLFEITYTQSADVLYLFHPSHHPKRLSRFADAQWSFSDIPFEDGPYLDQNTTDITIDHGTMSGVRTNLYGVAGGGTVISAVGVPFFNASASQGNAQHLTPGTSVYVWDKGKGNGLGEKAFNSVKYINSKWVAVGNSGSVIQSSDGKTGWAGQSVSLSSLKIFDVTWGNSVYIIVGAGGKIYTFTSTWTSKSEKTSGTSNDLLGIVYDGSTQFVAVGESGTILYSSAGSTWTAATSGVTVNLNAVCYGSSMYVAVGDDGTILTDANGQGTWTIRTSGVNVDLKDVIWDGSRFVAVGDKGYILTSADGTTWAVRNYYPEITLHAVTMITGHWIAVGTDGMVAYSSNGTTWVYRSIQTATITASGDVFDYKSATSSNDTGRHVRLAGKGRWSWGKVLSVTDSTTALIEVRTRVYGEKPTQDWQLGAFYTSNYPKCGAFYEQRLVLAGTPALPCTLWGSVVSDYTNFAPQTIIGGLTSVTTGSGKKKVTEEKNMPGEIIDSSAFSYTIYGTTINMIKWIMPTKVLLIGTTGGVKKLSGSSPDASLTPFNVVVSDQSPYGVADLLPVKVGYSTLFTARISKKIRELQYQFEVDQLITPDITIMCDEITDTGVKDMTFQQEPYNIVWCATNSGNLIGFTYDAEHSIAAWHKHTTSGLFESVACIPGTTEDELWAIINYSGTRYIEKLGSFNPGTDIVDSFFVDAGATYDSTPATNITGLAHLNGLVCSVLADGLVVADATPTAGAITLSVAASVVQVGLPYTSELQTMNIKSPEIVAQVSKLGNTAVSLYGTGEGVGIGYDSSNYDEVSEDLPAGALTTVDKIMSVKKGLEREQYVYVRQAHPLPCTVLYIATEVVNYER